MSLQQITKILVALIQVHKQFNELAIEKTTIIQKSDMPALDQILKKETALITQLTKLEQNRILAVNNYLKDQGIMQKQATIEQLIEVVPENERVVLSKLQKALFAEIDQLKKQNELNQQLLEDSLHFVNLSLDLIAPDPDEVNYKRPNAKSYNEGMNRSIFDSKA